ncbi:MAG TPA: hypothetical protein VL426_01480 [Candidatus Binatia bacterium]|jgi:hypothetical protein|nr:hypothetical protein [Candidatus Binatia bacterium]
MRSPKILFALGMLAAAGVAATALAAHAERRAIPVAEAVRAMFADLETAAKREQARGCPDSGASGDGPCAAARAKLDAMHDDAVNAADAAIARPATERAAAIAAIRAFRTNDWLEVDYRSTSPNPYKDGEEKIEIYADDKGFEYWIDPARDVLVQAGPGAGLHPAPRKARPDARLPVPELRSRALAILERQMPGFGKRKSSLHPLEDHKDKLVYFFRWDDFSQPAKESEMPPFVQVALYADGELASYTDTLTR